jgi:hypothetical protein
LVIELVRRDPCVDEGRAPDRATPHRLGSPRRADERDSLPRGVFERRGRDRGEPQQHGERVRVGLAVQAPQDSLREDVERLGVLEGVRVPHRKDAAREAAAAAERLDLLA